MKVIPNWKQMPLMWSVQLATLGGVLELLYQNWDSVSNVIPQDVQDIVRLVLMIAIVVARGADQELDLRDDVIQ